MMRISSTIKVAIEIDEIPKLLNPFKIPFRCSNAKLIVEYTIKSATRYDNKPKAVKFK